jgi:hypothetical protein
MNHRVAIEQRGHRRLLRAIAQLGAAVSAPARLAPASQPSRRLAKAAGTRPDPAASLPSANETSPAPTARPLEQGQKVKGTLEFQKAAGLGTVTGAAVGAFLYEELRGVLLTTEAFSHFQLVIAGLLLLGIVLFARGGLMGFIYGRWPRVQRLLP